MRAAAFSDEELLDALRAILKRQGQLSGLIIDEENLARPALAHPVRRDDAGHRFPSHAGRYHFFAATSFRMALSSIASASSLFSLPFSSSSAFSRRASETSSPP